MKLLASILFSFLLAFSIPAVLVEKETVRESSLGKIHKKVKLYITKGYEREEIEQESLLVSPLPDEFLKARGLSKESRSFMRADRLIHFKKGRVFFYSPDDEEKSYTEEEFPGKVAVLELLGHLACNGANDCRLKVEPIGEWKELNGWRARKVVLEAMSPEGEFKLIGWYTKDSELLLEATKIHLENLMTAVGNDPDKAPTLKGIMEVLWDIFRKYGAMVMEERSDGIAITREVVKSVKKMDLPESFFRIPEGYRKVGK